MSKCANTSCGTDLADGTKFCGGCGTAAPTAMTKCTSGHECAGDQKFCAECGEPMIKAVEQEFDAALDAIVAMAKGGAAPESFVLPERDDDDPNLDLDATALLKGGADLGLPDGTMALDAESLLKSIHGVLNGAHTSNAKHIDAVLQSLGDQVVALRQGVVAMVKAQASQMQAFRALRDGKLGALATLEAAVTTIGAARNPRKAQVNFMAKSVQTGEPVPDAESPSGGVLIKAALDAENANMIKSLDVSMVEEMVNRGMSLAHIGARDPRLGNALAKQLQAGQTTH
jgi:hypothetical protein